MGRERTPPHAELALGLTTAWLIAVALGAYGLFLRQLAPPLMQAILDAVYAAWGPLLSWGLPLLTLVLVLAWWWAIREQRRMLAADKNLSQLRALSPAQFEEWVEARFRQQGWTTKLTGQQSDHGVDIIVRRGDNAAVVQCKKFHRSPVGEPTIRDLYGAMHDFKAQEAFIVTTSSLTKPARRWMDGKPITAWDGDYLVNLSQRAGLDQPEAPQLQGQLVAVPSPIDVAVQGATASNTDVCPQCGSQLVRKTNSRTGVPFIGCTGFRTTGCKYTR